MTLSLDEIKQLARETVASAGIDAEVLAVTPREGADDSAEILLSIRENARDPRVSIGVPRHADRSAVRKTLVKALETRRSRD
jgi:hypothetical protein